MALWASFHISSSFTTKFCQVDLFRNQFQCLNIQRTVNLSFQVSAPARAHSHTLTRTYKGQYESPFVASLLNTSGVTSLCAASITVYKEDRGRDEGDWRVIQRARGLLVFTSTLTDPNRLTEDRRREESDAKRQKPSLLFLSQNSVFFSNMHYRYLLYVYVVAMLGYCILNTIW